MFLTFLPATIDYNTFILYIKYIYTIENMCSYCFYIDVGRIYKV